MLLVCSVMPQASDERTQHSGGKSLLLLCIHVSLPSANASVVLLMIPLNSPLYYSLLQPHVYTSLPITKMEQVT